MAPVPVPSLAASMLPSCSSTSRRATGRDRPRPSRERTDDGSPGSWRSNSRASRAGSMPAPSSRTVSSSWPPSGRISTSMRPPGCGELDGVGQQARDHLAQSVGVAGDRSAERLEERVQAQPLGVGRRARRLDRRGHQRRHVERPRVEADAVREHPVGVEQLVEKLRLQRRVARDRVEAAVERGRVGALQLQRLGPAEHCAQRRAQRVREVGDELVLEAQRPCRLGGRRRRGWHRPRRSRGSARSGRASGRRATPAARSARSAVRRPARPRRWLRRSTPAAIRSGPRPLRARDSGSPAGGPVSSAPAPRAPRQTGRRARESAGCRSRPGRLHP